MDLSSLVSPVAGAAPVRVAVNAGFHAYARRRMRELDRLDPVAVQERTLLALVREARGDPLRTGPRLRRDPFGRRLPASRPAPDLRGPLGDYLKDRYPVFEDLTWPGKIPYLALDQRHDDGGDQVHPGLAGDDRLEPQGRADDGGGRSGQRGPMRGSSRGGSSSWAARPTSRSPRPASARAT